MKLSNKLFAFSLFILLIVFFKSTYSCTCRRMTIEQYLNHSDYSCTFKVLDKTEKEEMHAIYYNGIV